MNLVHNKPTDSDELPLDAAKGLRVAIAVAEWNSDITFSMLDAAEETIIKYGGRVKVVKVPGTVELTYAAKRLMNVHDAVIVLGCVVRGETPHFDYVCQSVTHGITELNLIGEVPVIFGVLTTNTMEQAQERAGGKYGNKGEECAIAAIEMVKNF